MAKKLLLLSCGLALISVWIVSSAAGPDAKMTAVPLEQAMLLDYEPDRAWCPIARTSNLAESYFDSFDVAMQNVVYFNPADFCLSPVYPFEVYQFTITLYDDGDDIWPADVAIVVYGASDSCDGPGNELCRHEVLADEASCSFPNGGTYLFPSPCCVDGPFYIGLEYVNCIPGQTPSIVYDDVSPVDSCVNWFFRDGVWEEWSEAWDPPIPGNPIFWTGGMTASTDCPGPCIWSEGDPHKMHFAQLPDEDGWDVNATYPLVLADDFLCTETGYIGDLHFWGSWKNDDIGEIQYFILSIHDNIPADLNPEGYSIPGDLRWEFEVPIEWVDIVPIDPPTAEGWYDPSIPEVIDGDHGSYFQYNICIYDWIDTSQLFYQYQDTIYWLNISAAIEDPVATQWGWKNSENHWMDDAVWAYSDVLDWHELYEPGGSPQVIENDFWIKFDLDGVPVPSATGGTAYYDDGTSLNGWYHYPNTDWWNIWFYDHPLDTLRYKDISVSFDWMVTGLNTWIEVAVNWATDAWVTGWPPPIPPLTPGEEDLYIYRELIPISEPGHVSFSTTVEEYNPEWVSIDVRGQNIIVSDGTIRHQCLPEADSVSMDMAFVITGEPPCIPSIDVDKTVWEEGSGWVDFTEEDVGGEVEFQILVHNDGTCCDLVDVTVIDTLDDSFGFVGATPFPDEFNGFPGGMEMIWYYTGTLLVGNTLHFYVNAQILGPVCHHDTNRAFAEGYCDATGDYVHDADFASVHATEPDFDFGDVPDPTFPTLLPTGAMHRAVPGVRLGALIDTEPNGQPDAAALGDDNTGVDDEDGVVFTSLIVQGQPATVKVTASVAGYLDAWIDWYADGDWDDPGEHVFVAQPLTAGVNSLALAVPGAAMIGTTYGRFRFTTIPGGLPYDGVAEDGEVEDYRVFILEPIADVKMHWPQLPDLDETGLDIKFVQPSKKLADDFLCTETGLVRDIHLWGSFKKDYVPLEGPDGLSFLLEIWSNQPAVPPYPHSQPKDLLWSRGFTPGTYTATQVCDNNPEGWYDPATDEWLKNNHLSAYQYDFLIPPDSAFQQDSSRTYWLAVTLTGEETTDTVFGWKTAEWDLRWEDDAVWMAPTGGWLPLTYPVDYPPEYADSTLDLAFVITGKSQCGDVNSSSQVDIDDVVYLITYIFQGGPPPAPYLSGDVNCDGVVDIDDAVYLINWIFGGGPPPCDPNNDGIPDC